MIKEAGAAIIRVATRTYVQRAPWWRGKEFAAHLFHRYVAGRTYRRIVRTRFGDRMELHLPDLVSGAIYLEGQWEPDITQYIRANLAPGDIFVDVGANIGYYTLIASRLVGARGKVYAIEASPKIYARLMRNIEINNRTNITTLNAAASDKKGELPIFFGGKWNWGHTTTVKSLGEKEGLQFETMVGADRLDQLIGPELLAARLIKIDVEGAEARVLAPLVESLMKFNHRTEWLVEFNPSYSNGGQSDIDMTYWAFRRANYNCYKISDNYATEMTVTKTKQFELRLLNEPPSARCDVLMTRMAVSNIAASTGPVGADERDPNQNDDSNQ